MRMRNPYVVGSIVHQPHFYGRQTLVEDLLDERNQCIYLIGNRRIGKTSLLHYLRDQASCVALFLNLQSTGGDTGEMGKALAGQVERKARQIPVLQDVHVDTASDICDVVKTLAEAAEDGGFRVLLLWDEAEKLLLVSKDSLERLRSALQDARTVRTILAATKGLSELNDRCRSWKTSPFLFGFVSRYIPPLSNKDAVDLICQVNNPEGRVQVDEDLQAQIMDLTGNHPYLIQLLCDRLFQSEGKLRPITDRDLVVDKSLADLFQIDYDMLSHSERAIMRRLAEWGTGCESDLHLSLKLKPEKLQSYLYGLEQLGYIRYKDGHYQVANHFLCTWLRTGRVEETSEVVSDQASLEIASREDDMNYERGLEVLKAQLEQTNRYDQFNVLEARLLENLRDEHLFGPSQQNQSDRARVLDQLNRLALDTLGTSFNDLSLGRVSPRMQVSVSGLALARKLNVALTPSDIEPPVQPRLQHLLFNALTWEQFEALCVTLVEVNPLTIDCHLYGVQGDDQQGIDIVATQRGFDGTEVWAYQCKRYSQYTPGKLKEALAKMTYQADYYVLMLSIPATAALRKAADAESSIFLWDANDIARKLKNYPVIIEDFFGTAWRKAFCG